MSRQSKRVLAMWMAVGVAAGASLEGVVRNSLTGEPVVRAHVSVSSYSLGKEQQYGAVTDASGKFSVATLPAGSYRVFAEKTGFITPTEKDGSVGTQMEVTADDPSKRLDLKLIPGGAIAGRVVDSDGEPVEGITVIAEIGTGNSGRSAVTDDLGRFRMGGLAPRKYRVKARPGEMPLPPEIRTDGTTEVRYVSTYYPETAESRSATRIEVKPGVETSGIEIRLVRMPIVKVSGVITGLPKGAPEAFVQVQRNGGGMGFKAKRDGLFELWRLDPGKYNLVAYCNWNGQQLQSAPLDIEVGSSNLEHLELRIVPASDLSGQVAFEDERAKGQSRPRRLMFEALASGAMLNTEITDDGSFRLNGVEPGRYRVIPAWQPAYVRSMQLGTAQMDGSILDLRNGSGGAPVSILISAATGELSGTVAGDDGPAAGVGVSIEPADGGNTRLFFADENGLYKIPDLAPGTYRVWTDEGEDAGATVDVRPGEKVKQDLKK